MYYRWQTSEAVPQMGLWMNQVEGVGWRKQPSLCGPFSVCLRLIKGHGSCGKTLLITTLGRYGVSGYCQDSLPSANSRANNLKECVYGVKWFRNFLWRSSVLWLWVSEFVTVVISAKIFSDFIFGVLMLNKICVGLRSDNHICMLAN